MFNTGAVEVSVALLNINYQRSTNVLVPRYIQVFRIPNDSAQCFKRCFSAFESHNHKDSKQLLNPSDCCLPTSPIFKKHKSYAETQSRKLRTRNKKEGKMENWLRIDPNRASRAALEKLGRTDPKGASGLFPSSGDPQERIEFGTAGLRAAFGPGPLRMNDVTVMQTAQGLLRQLTRDFGEEAMKSRGVVIGYDHRESREWGLSSKGFALGAACVFLARGYKVYLMDELCPTPFVPFAIQEFKAVAGFMMTASHNPKDDAGFKVYWDNACQLVAPKDEQVTKQILTDLTIDPKAIELLGKDEQAVLDLCQITSQGLVQRIAKSYVATATAKLCRFPKENARQKKRICYTAMHGVGLPFEAQLFEAFGHPQFVRVPAQAEPDPDFPSVPFPNPEEKGALNLATKYASEHGCELVIANDPDADRCAVAEYDPSSRSWVMFSGDEIAALFAWWELEMRDRRQQDTSSNEVKNRPERRKSAMVVSAVSSGFVRAMGEKRDCEVFEALTGFKWIGTKALELRTKHNYEVLFTYEEAIGFCLGDVICDKDGITAGAVFAEMYNFLVSKGQTCFGKLDELRQQYGYFLTQNGYIKTSSPKAFFMAMRHGGRYASVVGRIANKPFKVKRLRDLDRKSYIDTAEPDGTPKLPFSSNMITFYLEPLVPAEPSDLGKYHVRVTLRASGTEPKLKYYVEANGPDPVKVRQVCSDVVASAVLGDLLNDEKSKL